MNKNLDQLVAFCPKCNKDVSIERIIRELDKSPAEERIYLTCSHNLEVECNEKVNVTEELRMKHKNKLNKLLGKFMSKTSGTTKRPAREQIIIDRERKLRIHKVEEQDLSGNWILVHYHEDPI